MISWRQRVRELEAENALLRKKVEEYEKRIVDLERRLLAYENAHTPPSQRYKPRQPPVGGGKRGAPEGHDGATRPDPKPTLTVEHVLQRCEHCKKLLGEPSYTERRLEGEIPMPQPIEVTEHLICERSEPGPSAPHFSASHEQKHHNGMLPSLTYAEGCASA